MKIVPWEEAELGRQHKKVDVAYFMKKKLHFYKNLLFGINIQYWKILYIWRLIHIRDLLFTGISKAKSDGYRSKRSEIFTRDETKTCFFEADDHK